MCQLGWPLLELVLLVPVTSGGGKSGWVGTCMVGSGALTVLKWFQQEQTPTQQYGRPCSGPCDTPEKKQQHHEHMKATTPTGLLEPLVLLWPLGCASLIL